MGSWVHPLNTSVAAWLSSRRRRGNPRTLGPVFGDRPGTNQLPLERTLPLLAYIHNNPVTAGVVESARHSCWSSHAQYIGAAGPRVSVLAVSRGLELCGMGPSEFDDAVNDAARRPQLVDAEPESIVAVACLELGCRREDLLQGSKRRDAVHVRRVALAVGAALGHSCTRMAAALGISPAAAAKLRRTSQQDAEHRARELVFRWRATG